MNKLDDDIKTNNYFLKCLKSDKIPMELHYVAKWFINSPGFKQNINIKTLTNKTECIYHINAVIVEALNAYLSNQMSLDELFVIILMSLDEL